MELLDLIEQSDLFWEINIDRFNYFLGNPGVKLLSFQQCSVGICYSLEVCFQIDGDRGIYKFLKLLDSNSTLCVYRYFNNFLGIPRITEFEISVFRIYKLFTIFLTIPRI